MGKRPYRKFSRSRKPKLISFRQVRIRIPRKYILGRYYKGELLTEKETQKLRQKLREIERAINKLKHVQSIVEKCLYKRGGGSSIYL